MNQHKMELPKPNEDETREDFTNRCMDDSIMNKEYPNQDKRNDVSNSLWYGKKLQNYLSN